MNLIFKQARRLVIAVVGGTVILIGVAMFFLPGPATIVIPVGLAILATEFVWARRLLKRVKQQAITLANAARNNFSNRSTSAEPDAGEDAVVASSSPKEK